MFTEKNTFSSNFKYFEITATTVCSMTVAVCSSVLDLTDALLGTNHIHIPIFQTCFGPGPCTDFLNINDYLYKIHTHIKWL